MTAPMPMTRVLLSLLVTMSLVAPTCAQTLEIAVRTPDPVAATARLLLHDFDVVSSSPDVRVFGSSADLAAIVGLGFEAHVLHHNVEQFYASRLQPSTRSGANPPFGQGSMGGYYTASECVLAMDGLHFQYPNLVAPKVSLGLTVEGRDIWMWKVSDNPLQDENEPEVLIDGCHHAREPIALQAAVWLAKQLCEHYGTDAELTELVDKREIYIVPLVNVDGYVYNATTHPNGGGVWRKNRRLNADGSFGVDPNRNYGFQWGLNSAGSSAIPSSPYYRGVAAFSEPCTQAIQGLANGLQGTLSGYFSMHAYGGMVFVPPGYASGATASAASEPIYATLANEMSLMDPLYATGHSYALLGQPSNGTSLDWFYGSVNGGDSVWSFSAELGGAFDGFWPPTSRIVPICEDALVYLKHVIRVCGPDPRISDVMVAEVSGGTVSGGWDPGEVLGVTVTVLNGGTQGAAFELSIESESPWLTTLSGPVSVGSVGPNGGTLTSSTPVQLQVDPAAPIGAAISFDVVVRSPLGIQARRTISQPIGLPKTLVFTDDFESPNAGWTTDNEISSAGNWVRTDPTGTSFAGQIWNPENDHTPGSGTDCWVTGNASPSAGNHATHDVDGITSLVSPLLDASHVHNPAISYWRWFAASNVADPRLEVWLSNDAGTTWLQIDSVLANQPSWREVSHRIEDHMPRTSAMKIKFRAVDWPSLDILEVAIDDFRLHGFQPALDLTVTTAPTIGATTGILLSAPHFPAAPYILGVSRTAAIGIPVTIGTVPLDMDDLFDLVPLYPAIFSGFNGNLDAAGMATASLVIPSSPSISGWTFILSGVTLNATPDASSIAGGQRFILP